MSLTKKQIQIIDALNNGGYIWTAGNSYYLAEVVGATFTGQARYESHPINARTFKAIGHLLKKDTGGRERWRIK